MKPPKKFGVWGNIEKENFWKTLPEILSWSKEKKIDVYLTERIKSSNRNTFESSLVINSNEDIGNLDFMLALGGDGTFLSSARAVENRNIPILGIHLGDLGFLAKVNLDDLFQRLDQVADGMYVIEKRSMIRAIINKNGLSKYHTALNDFVVKNNELNRMLSFTVYVDGHLVCNYKADGLIIATPTGSTAYSLSSGGPIISPDVDSFVVTPISPHSLTSRPLVVSANSKIDITFPDETDDMMFTVDGQLHEKLNPSNEIKIKRATYEINLIDFIDNDYFETLRTKMGWGKRGDH
tara:strand:- start:113701 stop:114582 length:882 start_codon:yes stop_codon:yes gene_type:complete